MNTRRTFLLSLVVVSVAPVAMLTPRPDKPRTTDILGKKAAIGQALINTYVTIHIESDNGMVSTAWIEEQLIPALNDVTNKGNA